MDIPENIVSEMRKIHKKGDGKTEIYTEKEGRFCGIFRENVFQNSILFTGVFLWYNQFGQLEFGGACDCMKKFNGVKICYGASVLLKQKATAADHNLGGCYREMTTCRDTAPAVSAVSVIIQTATRGRVALLDG